MATVATSGGFVSALVAASACAAHAFACRAGEGFAACGAPWCLPCGGLHVEPDEAFEVACDAVEVVDERGVVFVAGVVSGGVDAGRV